MKKLSVLCSAIVLLSASADLLAQTRGPRYNPGGGSSSSSPSSSSSSSTSRSTPSSSSTPRSTPSSSSSSTPVERGPRYNPGGSSSSTPSSSTPRQQSSTSSSIPSSSSSRSNQGPTRPNQQPSSSSSSSSPGSSTPRGPRYNPGGSSSSSSTPSYNQGNQGNQGPVRSSGSYSSVPRGPRYNPNPRSPQTNYYQSIPHYQTRVRIPHINYVHVPTYVSYNSIWYNSPRDYYMRVNRHYVLRSWIQEPVIFSYSNGYWMMDNYPYYVYSGFRYRYHPVELCQYQLVDGSSYTSVQNYGLRSCSSSYDSCAYDRESWNNSAGYNRYFCAEGVDYDLANNNDDDYYASPLQYDDQKLSAIDSYLLGKTELEIFQDAEAFRLGDCQIDKLQLNARSCKYQVRIGQYVYPETDGSVCSDEDAAAQMGCDIGTEKENAGCILKAAVQEGYCQI
jgi:hypothetical protein